MAIIKKFRIKSFKNINSIIKFENVNYSTKDAEGNEYIITAV